MAIVYSTDYKQNPLRPSLYEQIGQGAEHAGIVYDQYFSLTVPVGTTTGDILKLTPFQTAVAVATPQVAGIRVRRLVYTTSGNVGGSVTANLGFAVNSATAYGAAVTTLQSAATTDVAIATIQAGPVLLVPDELQFVITAGTSTTSQTIIGFVQYTMTAP